MARKIDLNADMCEGFGAYDIGGDAVPLKIVRSANLACGFHAGDPAVMRRLALACEAFADRLYEDDGNLTPRNIEGSVIRDPAAVARPVREGLEQAGIEVVPLPQMDLG